MKQYDKCRNIRIVVVIMTLLAGCVSILSGHSQFKACAGYFDISSPDKKIKVSVDERLNFSVSREGNVAFKGVAGLELLSGKKINKVKSPRYSSLNRDIATPFYRCSSAKEHYNSLFLKASDGWGIEFRVFDDGMAWRWSYSGKNVQKIKEEKVEYTFLSDGKATMPYVRTNSIGDFESQFFNSFENTYAEVPLSQADSRRLAFLPLVVEPMENIKVLLTESDVVNYPGMYLNRREGLTLNGVFANLPKKLRKGGYLNAQMLVEERERTMRLRLKVPVRSRGEYRSYHQTMPGWHKAF